MIVLDLGCTVLKGIVADDVLRQGFDRLDDLEFRTWLRRARRQRARRRLDSGLGPLRRQLQLRGRRPHPSEFCGGCGAPELPAHLPRVARPVRMGDAVRDGGRRVLPLLSGAQGARRQVRVLPPCHLAPFRRGGEHDCHDRDAAPGAGAAGVRANLPGERRRRVAGGAVLRPDRRWRHPGAGRGLGRGRPRSRAGPSLGGTRRTSS